MRQIYKITIIALFLFSFSIYSQTQEAIIYFKDGDSIEGFAALKFNKIKFKVVPEDKADTWDAEFVKKITFIGFDMTRTFEYITISSGDKPTLVETIVKGEVTLYKKLGSDYNNLFTNPFDEQPLTYYNPGSNLNRNSQMQPQVFNMKELPELYYVKKENDKYPTCLNCGILNAWRKNTSKYFTDCDFIVKKLKGDKWLFENLKDIVEFYNDICFEK